MKRKDLLLVTFLLSQTVPVWAMDPPEVPTERPPSHNSVGMVALNPDEDPVNKVQRLKQSLLDVQRTIIVNPATVFLIGITGSGKSTLMNFLVGKPLFADARGRLDTIDPVQGSEIGHTKTSKTTHPSFCLGPDNIMLCDSAGFGDSRGPEQELINRYTAYIAFSGQCKFLVTVSEKSLTDRAGEFIDLVNNITQTIHVDQLKDSLALIVTKQGSSKFCDPHQELRDIIEEDSLTEDGKHLLLHLTDSNNIHFRVPFFPCQNIAGRAYDAPESSAKILESIHQLKFILNPHVKMQLPPKSMIHILHLAGSLNKEVENSLHLLRPLMIQLSTLQADRWLNPGSLETLKTQGESIGMSLRALEAMSSKHIENFVTPLNLFITEPELRKQHLHGLTARLQLLSFLKEVSPEVSYSKAEWSGALQETLKGVHGVIGKLSTTLGSLITYQVKSTINEKVTNFCSTILQVTEDEEKKITNLKEVLTILKTGIDMLPHGSVEKMNAFANSFNSFFESPEDNMLTHPMKALNDLKSIKEDIHYPAGEWSEALQPSVTIIQSMIADRERLLQAARVKAAEEEAARVEREQAEEVARVEREEARRQAHAQLQQEIDRHNALVEADRRVHAAEVARREAALESERLEHARRRDEETERQHQEMARIEAALAASQQAVSQQAAANRLAEVRIAAALALAQQATQQLAAQQAENNRLLEADRAERTRLTTPITFAVYKTLPKNKRRWAWETKILASGKTKKVKCYYPL